VQYSDQLLRINAFNSTLADILAKIAALTGANIEIPAGARSERMVADLGPGPPRQIITALLTDTDFDFVVTSSNGDPESILTVLLTPRDHSNGSAGRTVLADRPAPNFRGMQPERMRAGANSADGQAADDSSSAASESTSAEAAPVEAPADSSAAAAALPDNAGAGRIPDASSGQTVQQSMNQQLLQLYKQREQQIQEQRTPAHPPSQ
jgi:hypothetical protein